MRAFKSVNGRKPRRPSAPIPTYPSALPKIKSMLKRDGSLALLFIDASQMSRIERAYGRKIYGRVLEALAEAIASLRGRLIRNDDLAVTCDVGREQHLVFLSRKRTDRNFCMTGIEGVCDRVSEHINGTLYQEAKPYLKARRICSVGYAVTLLNPLIREERQIAKLLEEAREMAAYRQLRGTMRDKEKIQELILKEAITTHFQPIVQLSDYRLLGYEALSRGPSGTEYEAPDNMFAAATELNLEFELDRLCRRKALVNGRAVRSDLHLFVNCLPAVLHDPEFSGKPLRKFLGRIGLSPSQIVMEISERAAIENFDLFRKAALTYQQLGFSIAMDDVGAGHASLESALELRPRFLKLDLSIVRGIDRDLVKRELVRGIVKLARSMRSYLIAEGIETRQELNTLVALGVPYGQGFYIARPGPSLARPVRTA